MQTVALAEKPQTKKVSKKALAAGKAVREARAKGESTARALFMTKSPKEQAAYLRTHL